jgi:hypothetical protein
MSSRITYHASRLPFHVSRSLVVIGLTLLIALSPLAVAHAAPLALPPLPPPPPLTPGEAASTFTGGFIDLRVEFPQTWPAQGTHWSTLWTTVQWLDEWGRWRDVEGWQGSLDEIVTETDGTVVGHKTWWVARDDLGKGPFRWQVYRSQGGWLLAQSDTFDMPARKGQVMTVEVTLRP